MRCSDCGRKLNKAYFIGGKAYGPNCFNKIRGYSHKSAKVNSAKEIHDSQLSIFEDEIDCTHSAQEEGIKK